MLDDYRKQARIGGLLRGLEDALRFPLAQEHRPHAAQPALLSPSGTPGGNLLLPAAAVQQRAHNPGAQPG